jgi:hypothetical protein
VRNDGTLYELEEGQKAKTDEVEVTAEEAAFLRQYPEKSRPEVLRVLRARKASIPKESATARSAARLRVLSGDPASQPPSSLPKGSRTGPRYETTPKTTKASKAERRREFRQKAREHRNRPS